ncbi:MAG: NADH-quinone oxidoreductase subunit J [Planctomycetales bacterium]
MIDINWHTFFFMLFAAITCLFSVMVVVTTNIVRMAVYLIVALSASAGLFFLAGADFVGSMQLMIYVGGTLVLLIFGVMLTAQGPFISMKTSGGEWVLAVAVGVLMLAVLIPAAVSVSDWNTPPENSDGVQQEVAATEIGLSFLGPRPDAERAPDEATREKQRQSMPGYLHPFEIVSVHLLIILIGAAYLARAKKPEPTETTESV